jgi:hypothetical protein
MEVSSRLFRLGCNYDKYSAPEGTVPFGVKHLERYGCGAKGDSPR